MAPEVTAHSADSPRQRPKLQLLEDHLGRLWVREGKRRPEWFTADSGYCSEYKLRMFSERQIDAYVATN